MCEDGAMKVTICCLLSFATSALAVAQDFGPPQVITVAADVARSVYASDLDGDGDADVLSASSDDDKIAWYENQGGGVFGPQQVITTSAEYAQSVYATDLDGDGDVDVISGQWFGATIAWYENLGGGVFGAQQAITSAGNVNSVYATDLDGDGDADVLSASDFDDRIAWYENRLDESTADFGPQQVITTSANGARSVYATDLDGDGDADVLSASSNDDKIAWYENQGGGVFGGQQVITTSADAAMSVYATDLDGDGDADVLSASILDDKIVWYRNRLNKPKQDFSDPRIISTSADGATLVYAADLNGDGAPEVISASQSDDKVAWYQNYMGPFDCNGNGIPDPDDIANGTSTDCDGNGRPDECDVADTPSADWNGDGIHDACTPPNYCSANPNTTGLAAVISASGSPVITTNNLWLTASQMPAYEWGYFLMAETQGFIPNVGGSSGNLCLGFPFYRFTKSPVGHVVYSGEGGIFRFSPDFTNLPPGVTFLVGATWDFQAWYRDGAASTSNFTDGIEVMFR
jgi:hypothetical protein